MASRDFESPRIPIKAGLGSGECQYPDGDFVQFFKRRLCKSFVCVLSQFFAYSFGGMNQESN
jgi:hypothetical protein